MPKRRPITPSFHSQILTFEKGRIRMEIQGQGDNSIIFLHGFNGNLEQWDPVWNLLSDCQSRLIRLDIPGFGQSDWQPADYSLAAQSARVIGLMDKLNIPRASFVGFSMGASLAAWIAASYPTRTVSLALLAPSGASSGLGYGGLFGFYTSNRIANTLGRFISKTRLFQRIFPNRMTIQALETSASYGRAWDKRLYNIRAPVWIAWSASDWVARAETAAMIHRTIPNSKLEWLSLASGHDLISSHAELIASRICHTLSRSP